MRKGSWIQTFLGRKYWPLDPHHSEVEIIDIAHALGMLCRYGGHSRQFYSVAEHSVLVSHIVRPERLALQGLMHDATEAYCVDVPRPLKAYLANYAEVEELNWWAIAARFDLPIELDPEVKAADTAICLAEREMLLSNAHRWEGMDGVVKPNVTINCYPPHEAKARFLARFRELT